MKERVVQFLFLLYRYTFDCLKRPRCRFLPSCSEYAKESLQSLPLGKACVKIIIRILRCHPWGGFEYDPVERDGAKK